MTATTVPPIKQQKFVRWLDRQQHGLFAMGRLWREYAGDLDRTIRGVTEAASCALEIDRVSVWQYDRTRRLIACNDLFDVSNGQHSNGMELDAARYPSYFAAMESEEMIAANDAIADPRTCEFAETYLIPLGIGAMLDAPIRARGQLIGVLCLEHVGGPREFRSDELNMCAYLANMIGAVIEIDCRCKTEPEAQHTLSQLLTAGEKLEEMLRDEIAVWRVLFEQSQDGIVVLDQSGGVVAANERYAEMLGYSMEEIHSLHVWDWDCKFDEEEILEMIRLVDETGDCFGTKQRRKDGTVIDVELSINAAVLKNRKLVFCIVRDVTERKRIEEHLRILATTDSLTGIANRQEFSRRLEDEIGRSRRYGTSFSVLMYDVDHFKLVNDTYGHLAGDKILQTVVRRVTEEIRSVDVAARWGGEEFMVLLPETDLASATVVAEKVRQAIARHPFDEVGPISASVGVAEFARGETSDSLLMRVDEALYRAKELGRNRVESAARRRKGPLKQR